MWQGETMNYGEELVYWYFRLNGFFPLTNFVLHAGEEIPYTSDCDVIAIRHPHVYEEVGGQSSDWDSILLEMLDFRRTIGIICEVKTGRLNTVFNSDNVNYAIKRFGFTSDFHQIMSELNTSAACSVGDQYQIAKILISNIPSQNGSYFHISLKHARDFIRGRIASYQQKYRDRMFFSSTLLQEIFWEVNLETESR
jgi:hypothetical protein